MDPDTRIVLASSRWSSSSWVSSSISAEARQPFSGVRTCGRVGGLGLGEGLGRSGSAGWQGQTACGERSANTAPPPLLLQPTSWHIRLMNSLLASFAAFS